jgi:ABC-2 type transport system permease protein
MISALFYLQCNSVKNRLIARLRRLKRPKYLVSAVIGAAFFYFYFFRLIPHSLAENGPQPPLGAFSESIGALLLLVGALLLGWVFPSRRAALAFTEAEVAFLFPAPITRRNLINYKLLRSQGAILFSTLFLTFVTGHWRYSGHIGISILGWWVILATLNLHNIAASFARTKLLDRGLTPWRRRLAVIALILVVSAFAVHNWPPLPAWSGQDSDAFPPELLAWLKTGLSSGLIHYLLYPFRLVVRPYFAQDASSFLFALGPALAVMALNYFWVMRADVAFEEASVEQSRKAAEYLTALRERRLLGAVEAKKAKRAPFKLAPIGPAPIAFLWKNLILAGHFFSWRSWLLLLWIVLIAGMVGQGFGAHSSAPFVIGGMCVVLVFMSILGGPAILRFDLRADLPAVEMLKLLPLRGWQIVLGELLAPLAILVSVQWMLILLAALLLVGPAGSLSPPLRLGAGLGAALLAPALDLIVLLVGNAAALLLPGWTRFSKDAPRGIETMGQSIIFMVGQLLVLLVTLLPASVAFALAYAIIYFMFGAPCALPAAALASAFVLFSEAAGAIYFLGTVLERFDVSVEPMH